jgi:hypothetical protein
MVQRFDRNTEAEATKGPEGPESKPSGVYPRSQRAEAGWGFVIPRADGGFDTAAATNGAVIGSGEGASTRLAGADVAPEHARIEVRADGVYLEDMNTPGGTYVGGVRARRIGVVHGDVVRFGNQLAVFVERGLAQYAGKTEPGPLVAGPHNRALWIDPALAHARGGRSFSIEGGAGLGKKTLAELASKERESAGPMVTIDARQGRADAVTQARAQKPMTWIILHAERLPRPAQIELAQAIGRTPGAMAIATFQTPLDRALADGVVAPAFAALFNGRRVFVPPLTARREDIPGIVRAIASKLGIPADRLTVDFLEVIARAGWPGGVTDIEEVVREAASSSEGPIHAGGIKRSLQRPPSLPPSPPAHDDPGLARARLTDALAKANGSIASAARTLGMSRQAVYREAQRLGLDVGKRRTK